MAELNNLKKLADFDNKTLLIVDDDNPFRDRLSRAMEKKGFCCQNHLVFLNYSVQPLD